MKNHTDIGKFIISLKSISAVAENVPFSSPKGYVSGLPAVEIRKREICISIPFFVIEKSTEIDRSIIHPLRYAVTAKYPSLELISFEDLSYQPGFESVDYSKPVGRFRHKAIQHMSKGEYDLAREELLSLYDGLIGYIQSGKYFDEARFCELLNLLIEPSLIRDYRIIYPKFSERFLEIEEGGK